MVSIKLLAIFGPEGLLWPFEAKECLRWAHLWFGTHLALGSDDLPPWPLFASLDSGLKGPKWPTDHGLWIIAYRPWAMDYGPCAIEALGGLNGPTLHNKFTDLRLTLMIPQAIVHK
ncbi:hypothetical protein O181_019666 [Austropuccinia psidii MF-1]|uniref:Uncharacterized protein n=1 Tax=Austropuccinia psidii MF-1 TaxID=1389203 RepID=A0A9Q3GU31_9BASI|nr:hypothetical protein [Austropuccinia psidii MF-1]